MPAQMLAGAGLSHPWPRQDRRRRELTEWIKEHDNLGEGKTPLSLHKSVTSSIHYCLSLYTHTRLYSLKHCPMDLAKHDTLHTQVDNSHTLILRWCSRRDISPGCRTCLSPSKSGRKAALHNVEIFPGRGCRRKMSPFDQHLRNGTVALLDQATIENRL